MKYIALLREVAKGVCLGVKLSQKHIVDAYVKVPIGLLLCLCILYGVNEIIIQTGINFPSSVTCMLVLYLLLIISAKVLGTHRTSKIVAIINIPGGFALRWINIFFTPAFIPLPLSDRVTVGEAFTIAGVFVFGFIAAMVVMAYFTVLLQRLLKKTRRSSVERADEKGLMDTDVTIGASSTAVASEKESSAPSSGTSSPKDVSPVNSRANSIELMVPVKSNAQSMLEQVPPRILDDLAHGDENEDELEFLSRRATRIEEAESPKSPSSPRAQTTGLASTTNLSAPTPAAHPGRLKKPEVDVKVLPVNKLFCERAILTQKTVQVQFQDRSLTVARFVQKYFDYFVFGVLFIVGLPVYYALDYSMPLHLSLAIVTFLIMINAPPPRWKRFLHPVLCSVIICWGLYEIFALIKHEGFLDMLREYKTGRTYLKLFNHRTNNDKPGAGDVFTTLMDVSIMSLSIPMYTYRNDLKRHFFALMGPILLMTATNFFIYPPVCYHLGISPEMSLGFAGRSVTLALGTPFVDALGGNQQLMACTTVLTGVIGALTGQYFMKLMRIREDDYVTRGVTLGLNCSAIATAHLLSIDPRAGAMSSLAFCLFGTFMVVLGSISPLAKVLQSWVGL